MSKHYYVYLMANRHNTVLYTGVTKDLARRVGEHKSREVPSFCKSYNIEKLVYYEEYDRIEDAIRREKQIKGGSRMKKVNLVMSMNPGWVDLSLEEGPPKGLLRQ